MPPCLSRFFKRPLLACWCLKVCFVHVLFLHMAKRPNGRLAQVLGTPVKFPSGSRANAIPWHCSSSAQKALRCRGALGVGGVRWAVEVSLGLSLKATFCNHILTFPYLIFFNCHSHNLVTGIFYIVLWDWVLLVLREPRVPL